MAVAAEALAEAAEPVVAVVAADNKPLINNYECITIKYEGYEYSQRNTNYSIVIVCSSSSTGHLFERPSDCC